MNKLRVLIFSAMLFVWNLVSAQQQPDSAAMIIDNYLAKMNFDNLNWQTVEAESLITNSLTPGDTLVLTRKFYFPQYSYVVLSYRGRILDGLFSDGTTFLAYDTTENAWIVSSQSRYEEKLAGYDMRGPLFNWKNRNVKLQYRGISILEGNEVYQIFVDDPQRDYRNYLFERSSGNLFLIVERQSERKKVRSVDWRAIHEYTPVGDFIFPTLESYQSDGSITVIATRVNISQFNDNQFKKP